MMAFLTNVMSLPIALQVHQLSKCLTTLQYRIISAEFSI